jgi:chaperonin GroES
MLRPPERKEQTAAGIYIPESAEEDKQEGVVVAVGKKEDGDAIPLKEGDRVLYGGYSNEEVEIDGEEYIFVDLKDILAKLG